MIRSATVNDLDRLLEMAKSCHEESPTYGLLSFSDEKVSSWLLEYMASPNGVVFVCERDQKIIGLVVAAVGEHWGSDDLVGVEEFLFVDKAYRGGMAAARLIATMAEWCRIKGAIFLDAGCTTAIQAERTIGLYDHLGFKQYATGVRYIYG